MQFIRSMFGAGQLTHGVDAVAATVYTPYHLAMFVLACFVVWGTRQAWDLTQKLTPWRAAYCLGVLVLSVLFMWTQTVNPFLYFQF